MNIVLGFLRGLKLPIKLLVGWLKKRRKSNELEEKQRKYVQNFAPRNVSWQKGFRKKKSKKLKKGKFSKKTNSFSKNRNY